jgi:eukaryotic-like serine/threonine-protein kinase
MKRDAGSRIGRYVIRAALGAGGMGEVYLAEDVELRRTVALKFLTNQIAADPQQMNRFVREARAASALNHPNILTIYEIGVSEGSRFIAAEYVAGETLRQKLENQILTVSETLDIAAQIAAALSAAHEAGIVHRDIKPENVMLREDGLVKVLDFGLAKLTGKREEDTEAETQLMLKTSPGAIMGTVAYMSPEQARGLPVDARTDVWSLGVCLYEMLARRQPFHGETMTDVLANILRREPPPLSTCRADLPAELERIVTKTLRKNEAERYQTAKDLLADLKTLQKRLEFEAELERSSAVNKGSSAETEIINARTQNSIAILPFSNMSADTENEYFCDGLAEELLNALAKIENLKVAARTSAFSFKGKNAKVSEIGKALGVKTVLEGSVRKSGNRLRITVQLVDAADGYHLWSERYDREMQDIFEVQDQITLSVVDALKLKLLGKEKADVLRRYTDNPEAYQHYLKGQYYWLKGTPEGVRKSRDFFQRAIDLDPTHAPSYVGLGGYYGFSAALGWLPPEEGWLKHEAATMKALELDETLPDVHNGLAALKMFYYRDWSGAEREVRRAIELNPKFGEVHSLYSIYLVAMRRFDEAIAEVKRALEIDPLSVRDRRYLGNWLYYARHYDEAIRQYHEALEIDPNEPMAHENLGDVFERKGLHGEAIKAWQKAMTLAGDIELATILADAYAADCFSGAVIAVARKKLESLNERVERSEHVPAIEYARAYIRLGDNESAFQWLEKACEERNMFSLMLNSDPFYDSLRDDLRFQDLVRRVGLPTDEHMHAS